MAKDKSSRGVWETEYGERDERPFEGPPPYVGYYNLATQRQLVRPRRELKPAK